LNRGRDLVAQKAFEMDPEIRAWRSTPARAEKAFTKQSRESRQHKQHQNGPHGALEPAPARFEARISAGLNVIGCSRLVQNRILEAPLASAPCWGESTGALSFDSEDDLGDGRYTCCWAMMAARRRA
jgi:hypothetical protein